jgi:two-component system cell cycle sensor histidine kinase/response regulator CckA
LARKPSDSRKSPAPASPGTSHETVLVIEDDPTVRQMVVRGLALAGFQTVASSSGQAMEAFRRHAGRISIVVSDLALAEISSRDLVARLQGIRPDLPILSISGYPYQDLRRRGLLQADAPFLQKPFPPELLISKVRQLLDQAYQGEGVG